MEKVFTIAGALLVLLEVCGAVTKKTARFLPLGGSHIVQLGIVFGSAFVIYELMSVMR